ncbi:MAG: hypothetical protein LC708_01870, partial [Actinobacteria bacterium]|nr:hypothetical protein [Actinomycetota bacterium]
MRRLAITTTVAVALTAATAAAPAGAADDQRPVRPLAQHGELGTERLSDERRVSRYAGAVSRAAVRALPSPNARRVGTLHFLTEDGPFEVY